MIDNKTDSINLKEKDEGEYQKEFILILNNLKLNESLDFNERIFNYIKKIEYKECRLSELKIKIKAEYNRLYSKLEENEKILKLDEIESKFNSISNNNNFIIEKIRRGYTVKLNYINSINYLNKKYNNILKSGGKISEESNFTSNQENDSFLNHKKKRIEEDNLSISLGSNTQSLDKITEVEEENKNNIRKKEYVNWFINNLGNVKINENKKSVFKLISDNSSIENSVKNDKQKIKIHTEYIIPDGNIIINNNDEDNDEEEPIIINENTCDFIENKIDFEEFSIEKFKEINEKNFKNSKEFIENFNNCNIKEKIKENILSLKCNLNEINKSINSEIDKYLNQIDNKEINNMIDNNQINKGLKLIEDIKTDIKFFLELYNLAKEKKLKNKINLEDLEYYKKALKKDTENINDNIQKLCLYFSEFKNKNSSLQNDIKLTTNLSTKVKDKIENIKIETTSQIHKIINYLKSNGNNQIDAKLIKYLLDTYNGLINSTSKKFKETIEN